MEQRALGKLEASLGLSLIAALLVVLGGVYVHQLDEPAPVAPPRPSQPSAHAVAPAGTAVEPTAYRPEWLPPQGEPPQPSIR